MVDFRKLLDEGGCEQNHGCHPTTCVCALAGDMVDEIERLRAAAVWHCEACGAVTRDEQCDCTLMETGTQKLVPYDYRAVHDAEIERLRDALKAIEATGPLIGGDAWHLRQIARRALTAA